MSSSPSEETMLKHAGLLPVCGVSSRVLVLGSFPSILSLAHHEYYGNPKNRFWAIMEELFCIPSALPYPERCRRITARGIALWDIVATCSRPGSSDSRIRNAKPNDIAGFIRTHPGVVLVALNGRTAGRLYHRLAEVPGIPSITLPSTSPANAAVRWEEKVRAWDVVRAACIQD